MMTSALQGCTSHSQLEVTHKILLKHLLVAQQTVAKYEAQYRQAEIPLSPLSTVLELYKEFDAIESVDNRMRFMLDSVPHHQSQILPAAQEALRSGLSWDIVNPTQPLPSSTSLPLSAEPPQALNTKGKKKVDWDDSSPWENTSTSIEQGRELDEGLEPSFGFQTPFKKGTHFFDPSADGPSSGYFSTPGSMFTPNITMGLVTPSRTELGDNVREYNANQGANTFLVTKQTATSAKTTTTAMTTSSLTKSDNSNPPTVDNNGVAHTSLNRGGGNNPSRSGGPSPPGGGGGGGPPYRGGRGGGSNGGGGGYPSLTPHNHTNNSPNMGGGGGSDPSRGGGGNPGGEWPSAPYGNMPAFIKMKLKVEQLLEWDSNHWTTIDYFWQVQQLAYLGGWLPEALGYWLWFRLKDSSPIRHWFVTLPITHQSYMQSHYLRFLKGIKDGFLGHQWQLKMNNYYNSQLFCERNHERELPSEFIIRCIIYSRMLLSVDAGGPLEVFYVMRKALVSWGPILLLSGIKDSSELYSRVTEHEEALLEALSRHER